MLLIPAGNPSSWTGPTGNNTYLLTGRVPTLVDAGVGFPDHLDAVTRALDGAPLALVLVTHGHPDHLSGVPRLLERWPDALVRSAAHVPLADDESIEAGETRLRALYTPGHAPDHFCFVDETTHDVFCGDLARLGGSIVIPSSKGGNLADYLASLRKVRALEPRRLLPGHGPVIDDPAALLDEYLRHRAEREAQIVEALRSNPATIDAIVGRVYGELASPLVRAAADTVRAHLLKLAAEGRASEADGGWRLR